jgi:hypothetical protein
MINLLFDGTGMLFKKRALSEVNSPSDVDFIA